MSYSPQLADFVCATHFEDIPAPVTARARQLLIDTLGVGLAGGRHPNAIQALAGIKAIPGAIGERPVIGSEVSLTAPYAALVNGVACHALDFDDTHTELIVHGSAILAPLTLALAEETAASGRAALSAFILGWEVAARIGIASGNSFHQRGFHSTAIAGIFGAIATAGKLLGLSPEQLTHAFGLGGSQAAGINEFLSNNSAAKGYHVGRAAHNAMLTAWACRAAGPRGRQRSSRGRTACSIPMDWRIVLSRRPRSPNWAGAGRSGGCRSSPIRAAISRMARWTAPLASLRTASAPRGSAPYRPLSTRSPPASCANRSAQNRRPATPTGPNSACPT